jgi:hypothetical protein
MPFWNEPNAMRLGSAVPNEGPPPLFLDWKPPPVDQDEVEEPLSVLNLFLSRLL